jgi:hypothetical protein
MQFGACFGLDETSAFHRSSIFVHGQNNYIDKEFFDGKNYQAILDCINGG